MLAKRYENGRRSRSSWRRSHVPQKGKAGVGGLIIIISSKNGISRGRVQKQEL